MGIPATFFKFSRSPLSPVTRRLALHATKRWIPRLQLQSVREECHCCGFSSHRPALERSLASWWRTARQAVIRSRARWSLRGQASSSRATSLWAGTPSIGSTSIVWPLPRSKIIKSSACSSSWAGRFFCSNWIPELNPHAPSPCDHGATIFSIKSGRLKD